LRELSIETGSFVKEIAAFTRSKPPSKNWMSAPTILRDQPYSRPE
jgi:hypothetical protein